MAVDTPLHLERLLLVHQRHSIDLSVAGRAADALVDVNTMIEVDEVREVVHARPPDRPSGLETLADRIEKRAV